MAGDWYITDPDCLQCHNGSSGSSGNYEFVQINSFPGHVDGKPFYQVAHGFINLKDYSEKEIQDALGFFGYESMDDLILQTNPDGEYIYNEDGTINTMFSPGYDYDTVHRLLAEMFFEMECQEYTCEEFDNWNKAVSYVSDLVNLGLMDHYEKSDLDFVLLADPDTKALMVVTVGELPKGFFLERKTIRHIPDASPEIKTYYFSKGLDELKESFGISDFDISPKAKAQLPGLLEPIIEANIGRDKFMFPIPAINWARDHEPYVDALDYVFSTLDLISVERRRPSVTQGEAAVHCNGVKIVQYGDDIKLHNEKRDGIFDSVCTDKPLYGPVIGGWGSTKPDSLFRKAALTQYCKDIVRAFEKERSLDALIGKAEKQVTGKSTGGLQRESGR